MKKSGIIALLLGLLFIVTAFIIIFISKNKVENKEYKEITWNEFYGEPIPSEYEIHTCTEYKNYKFNIDTQENNKSFNIQLPKDIKLESMDTDYIKYSENGIYYTITKTNIINMDTELNIIKENNESLYEKIYIENAIYDKNIFAIIFENSRYSEDKTQMYFGQELKIYLKINESNDYVVIIVNVYEKRIDKELISKIINSITIEEKNIKFCNEKKCETNLNNIHSSLNHKFNLKIDNNKYVLEENSGISNSKATFITKEYDKVSTNENEAVKKLTRINLKLVYNNDSYLTNLPYQEEIIVEGKQLLASVTTKDLDDITQYKGTYIYSTSDNILVIIEIDSRLDNVEEVLKDFLNFELN